MVEFQKIRTAFIEDIKLLSRVTTEKAMVCDIIPKVLTDLGGNSRVGHPRAEMRTCAAIDGSPGKNRLPAHAAFFDQLFWHHDSFILQSVSSI